MLPTYYTPGCSTCWAVYSAGGLHVAYAYAANQVQAVALVRMFGRAAAYARQLTD